MPSVTPSIFVPPSAEVSGSAPATVRVDQYEGGSSASAVDDLRTSASAHDREAILASLYAERQRVNRERRLGRATPNDEEYLGELNEYIDWWEAPDSRAEAQRGVWSRLEQLAEALLGAQAEIARHKK